jgi:two-component system, NtrC family, sensor kinase
LGRYEVVDSLEAVLLDVSRSAAIDTGAFNDAVHLILRSLQQGLTVKRVSLWFYADDGQSMTCHALLDAGVMQSEPLQLFAEQFPLYFAALRSERAIVADDAKTNPLTREFSEEYLPLYQISAMLDLPIRHLGNMIGIICCEHCGLARQWSPSEVRFAGSLADQIGRALNAQQFLKSQQLLEELNASLEQRVQQRSEQLRLTGQDLEKAHQQILDQAKLATLGGIVAGVAHEVSSPLGVALLAGTNVQDLIAELLQKTTDHSLTAKMWDNYLQRISEGQHILVSNLQRAQRLMEQFKATAACQTRVQSSAVQFLELVQNLLASLAPVTKKQKVQIELAIDEQLNLITAADVWLQILTNLVLNSCQHAFTGILTPKIQIAAAFNTDHEFEFCYCDNGVGMDGSTKARVFEPFFTTREHDGGTGLGMSIIRQLVSEKLQGKLELQSASNEGFRLTIHCLA